MPEVVSITDRRSLVRIFPALRLVGAIRQAFDLRKILIAAIGLAALQPGWSLLDWLFPKDAVASPALISSFRPTIRWFETGPWSWDTLASLHARLSEPFRLLANPVLALVGPGHPIQSLHALLNLIWLFIVWGICGGAIARIAIVQVAALRQMTVIEALRFALSNAQPLILAPLCPLLGVAFCGAISASWGLLYRVPVVGPALAGIGLIVPLALGLVMTLLVAGLLGGWSLLQAATAAGAEDTPDALSRVFGYLNQRLGSFIAVVALAWLAGMLGLVFVEFLTAGVIRLTHWSLGLVASGTVVNLFFDVPATSPPGVASATHAFWLGFVGLLAHGWGYSFYWTAAANIYLWLRHAVDGSPWTAIEPTDADSSAPSLS